MLKLDGFVTKNQHSNNHFQEVHVMIWFVYEISSSEKNTCFFNGIVVVIGKLHYKFSEFSKLQNLVVCLNNPLTI
jgi:hypothetical protein